MEEKKFDRNLAERLRGGVIMDVTSPEQARIAEAAGAVAVMALERVPADIRAAGGVSRMSDPKVIKAIQNAVSIPVMAKCRIGHFVEAQILQALGIDYIDESEVLSPADDVYHVDKRQFRVPFVCGARDLGEALRRINEGAMMIRTKGEAGTGDVVQAVRHMRAMQSEIRRIGDISIIFCSDNYILDVNQQYLQHDYFTDIITFDYCEGDKLSGDLFISVDTVRENAVEYGTEFKDELNRVIVHGILHLIGYDDHTEEDIKEMRSKENYYLSLRELV